MGGGNTTPKAHDAHLILQVRQEREREREREKSQSHCHTLAVLKNCPSLTLNLKGVKLGLGLGNRSESTHLSNLALSGQLAVKKKKVERMDSSTDHHRPHRTTSINCSSSTTATATGELFICSTSRFHSSSSMKLSSSSSSSKTLLSLARARDAPPPSKSQILLSSSRSRRLRSNGSLKGGQFSPMFPSGGKKCGAAGIENPEPSSPKVTCIGQVRVKTRKQGKKLRTRSVRKGEVSILSIILKLIFSMSFNEGWAPCVLIHSFSS